MHRRPPASEPEVPAELSLPHVPPREVSDFRQLQQGFLIGRFERAFAQKHGVKHCIAAPGCTP